MLKVAIQVADVVADLAFDKFMWVWNQLADPYELVESKARSETRSATWIA